MYRKLILLLKNSIYLVFSSLEMQGRLLQTKYTPTSHKTLKVADTKNLFSSVHVIDAVCLMNVFILCDNWNTFLSRFIVTWRLFVSSMCWRPFKQVFWKRSVFYVCYLHNNITMLLIPNVQFKAGFFNFLSKFYFWNCFFTLFHFVMMFHISLHKWNF